MDVIGEIIRNVVALLLLATLLELLLPEGNIVRFIRVVIGLMLTASIMIPLLNALTVQPLKVQFEEDSEAAAAYLQQGSELAAELQENAAGQFSLEMGSQVAALALLAEGVAAAEAQLTLAEDGSIQQIALSLVAQAGADRSAAEAAVRTLISGFYLLQQTAITCTWQEALPDEAEAVYDSSEVSEGGSR